jgi:hypothetical protein
VRAWAPVHRRVRLAHTNRNVEACLRSAGLRAQVWLSDITQGHSLSSETFDQKVRALSSKVGEAWE